MDKTFEEQLNEESRAFESYKNTFVEKMDELEYRIQEQEKAIIEAADNYAKLYSRRWECNLAPELEALYLEKSRLEILLFSLYSENSRLKLEKLSVIIEALNHFFEKKSIIEFVYKPNISNE